MPEPAEQFDFDESKETFTSPVENLESVKPIEETAEQRALTDEQLEAMLEHHEHEALYNGEKADDLQGTTGADAEYVSQYRFHSSRVRVIKAILESRRERAERNLDSSEPEESD